MQQDGVSMGSPLGPTFASFYVCYLENIALEQLPSKPPVYCRYVDDCFVGINNMDELHSLKTFFETHSVLKFTYELEICKKLPFLDVLLQRNSSGISTSTYVKPTNSEECLNYNSLCPTK